MERHACYTPFNTSSSWGQDAGRPGSTERAICVPRQADTYPQDQCKGRAHEQIHTWFTGCNTFHRGDASASADHGEKGGYVNCAIEELAAEQEMHFWEITHAQAKETLTTEQSAESEELLQRRCHHKGKQ